MSPERGAGSPPASRKNLLCRSRQKIPGKREIAPHEITGKRQVCERIQRVGIVLLRALRKQVETVLNAACFQQRSGVMDVGHRQLLVGRPVRGQPKKGRGANAPTPGFKAARL